MNKSQILVARCVAQKYIVDQVAAGKLDALIQDERLTVIYLASTLLREPLERHDINIAMITRWCQEAVCNAVAASNEVDMCGADVWDIIRQALPHLPAWSRLSKLIKSEINMVGKILNRMS